MSDRAERVAAVAVVAAAEQRAPQRDARHERDRQRDRRRDRADEDVAVLHVRELVGEHAAQLVVGRGPGGCPGSRTTAAWFGLRPVANALGCISGGHVDLGHRHVGRAA